MTTELTKAAQQALEPCPLTRAIQRINSTPYSLTKDECVEVLRGLREEIRTLTQRPAAQTEREAFEAWWREHYGAREYFGRFEAGPVVGEYRDGSVQGGWNIWQARASLPAPQQATPEPLTLGPLAKRNIYDAIRGAYDLGYNDARGAKSVPGDGAPGYKGRDVEADHGSALLNLLNRRLASTQPAGQAGGEVADGPKLWWLCEAENITSGATWTREPDANDIAWVSKQTKRQHIAMRLVPQPIAATPAPEPEPKAEPVLPLHTAWEVARHRCKQAINEHRGFEIDAEVDATLCARINEAFEELHPAFVSATQAKGGA